MKIHNTITLFIKNMVCLRCIRSVEHIFSELAIPFQSIKLGEIQLETLPSAIQLAQLRAYLVQEGFELLDDRHSQLVEQIKNIIIAEIHQQIHKKPETLNFSDFLVQETGQEYSYLSKLFSTVVGITLEKYIIAQRIERVKEFLAYGEQTLSEIAWQMGYSSTQHLSTQFRQITGMTPSIFKTNHQQHGRKPLDQV